MKIFKTKAFKTLIAPMWENNPISVQILGICSALAVTVMLKTAVVMSLAVIFVLGFSNALISVMRHYIPNNIRIIIELVVVAGLVILADLFLKAFVYDVSKQLSVFVGLIITNCIIMGRAEGFALANPPFLSFLDGVGNGVGYGMILCSVACARELLGSGRILGIRIVPEALYTAGYEDMGLMVLAPGAFIVIGLLVWVQKCFMKEEAV